MNVKRSILTIAGTTLAFCVLLLYLVYSGDAQGKEFTINCPERYNSEDAQLKAPPGWRADYPQDIPLFAAGAMWGTVKRLHFLMPQRRELKNGFDEIYVLGPPEEKWFWCSYGLGGELLLSQRIPDDTEQCIINYRLESMPRHYAVVKIACGKRQ